MGKSLLIVLGILVILGGILFAASLYAPDSTSVEFDPRNATYTVANDRVTLVDGKAGTVEIFGGATSGDVNDDGVVDAVFFLAQTSEGSGTFFYVVAALNTTNGTFGTNAVLLGDRIAPQNITINEGVITAAYAVRAEDEPMTTPPSVGESMLLKVQNNILQEVTSSDYTFTYLTSAEETTAYCDGANMDSDGYRASLTVVNTGTIAKPNPTTEEIIRATIDAATTGMCHTAISQTTFTEEDGVVTISYIDGWAGISISMCSCKPQVEENILHIPGMKQVIWSTGAEAETDDAVLLSTPLPYATVSSPLLINGTARGLWFFEASFPISLLDSYGNTLGQGIAQAQGDWMTSDFVPFTATITFTAGAEIVGDAGTLVLQKDNPSGLPENEDSLTVPIIIGE